MRRFNRKALLFSSLTVGLLVGSPMAAFAADPPPHSGAGGRGTGQVKAGENRSDEAENRAAEAENRAAEAENRTAASENKDNPAHKADVGGSDTGRSRSAADRATAAEERAVAADNSDGSGSRRGAKGHEPALLSAPPGNNGTVKVDMNGDTSTRNNEPQGGCQDVIGKFFNFDGGEIITVAFSGQAPTEFTTTVVPDVTADADGNQAVSFFLAQIVPPGTAPAPNGGYHVRVEANGQNHPSGVKKKVFWLRCETSALVGSELEKGPASTVTPNPVQVRGVLIERSAPSEVAGTQQVRPAEPAAAAGVNRALRARVQGATVEGRALARTGFDVMHLVTLGGLALFAGYAALRVSRRNSEPSSSLIADR